jgi:hypothetical protein
MFKVFFLDKKGSILPIASRKTKKGADNFVKNAIFEWHLRRADLPRFEVKKVA